MTHGFVLSRRWPKARASDEKEIESRGEKELYKRDYTKREGSQMEASSSSLLSTATPTETHNVTLASQTSKYKSHNWAFLVAVLVTAISISVIIALLAKCQVVRRYLASYRHTRLRETDTVSQCDPAGLEVGFDMHGGRGLNPRCIPAVGEEDDDGFIEDNYIPASERARAARAAENMEDTEEEMDEIEFRIA